MITPRISNILFFRRNLSLVLALFFLPLSILADSPRSQFPPRPLEFGVFPHRSVGHLDDTFGVIAKRFESALNRRVNFNAQLSFDFFSEDLSGGFYDVVFLQPFDYVSAHEKHAYDVLATQKELLKALLVVRPSSKVVNVSDLKGSRISLPPEKTAISFLVRDWLRAQDLIVGKDVFLDYASSHVSCLQKALLGFGLVCGTAKPVLGFFSEKVGFEFLTIAETRAIPHTLFAVHPRVPQGERQKLLDVILHLHEGTDGKKLMDATRLSPFRHAEDSEYDIVRTILRANN